MKRYISAFLAAGMAIAMLPSQAQVPASASASVSAVRPASTPGDKPAVKKVIRKKTAKKAATPVVIAEDEKEPDVTGTTVIDYQCELGNKLTIFKNNDDTRHIALKWGKRVHRMERVDTTTGANRFENRHYGLVWIGIPAKAMLLDSKNGHQLANECKTAEQLAPKATDMSKTTLASPG